MSNGLRSLVRVGVGAIALSCVLTPLASAQTVWSGLTHSFTKPANADPTNPLYQDAITPNVSLTRDSSGLYNAASEALYTLDYSPELTMWATNIIPANVGETISATNWANLVFTDWRTAYGGANQLLYNTVATNAVVYLVVDDIYLDLQFTHWPGGFGAAGAFSYQRSEPVPEPATALLMAAGLPALAVSRHRRKKS